MVEIIYLFRLLGVDFVLVIEVILKRECLNKIEDLSEIFVYCNFFKDGICLVWMGVV